MFLSNWFSLQNLYMFKNLYYIWRYQIFYIKHRFLHSETNYPFVFFSSKFKNLIVIYFFFFLKKNSFCKP